MRSHRLIVATASALLVPAAVGLAAEAEDWDRLVRRLGAATLADREAAERQLEAAGVAALPTVVAARATAVGEAAFRLEWIQRELERRAALAAVEPAVVTLVARELPVRAALAELFARSGSRIELAPEVRDGVAGSREVTLALDRLTFWEAVDEILDAAGLALECDTGPPPAAAAALRITAGGDRADGPHVAAGPVRVAVADVEPAGRGARVTLRLAFEPRLEPLLVRLPARSIVAEGPAGEAMPAAQRAAVVEATVPRGRRWLDLPVRLSASAVPLESLAMLRGTLEIWLAGLDHGFRFPGVRPQVGALPPPQRVAAAEVRLLECAAAGDRLSVRASITYDAPSEALASHHTWLASRPLEAFAADDGAAGGPRRAARRLEPIEQRVEVRSDRGLTAAASFALPRGGAGGHVQEVEIVWTLPTAIHQVPVDFAILGVPLPPSHPP